MASDINEELGVDEKYADEIRERMDESGPPSLLDGVVDVIDKKDLPDGDKSAEWVALLVGAMMEGVRETKRRAPSDVVEEQAVSLFQDRIVNRALDGTLFDPLKEDHPETFRRILTEGFPEWAVTQAHSQVEELNQVG